MEVIHERCAGIDVHKDVVVVCVRIATGGRARCEVRSFGTTTSQLLALGDWLGSESVTHVAMESTGVYWKPVWHMLDGLFELTLGNATHIRNVPGRKSDVNDATWIADLLAHGLIRGSFVPPVEIQELRDLTRTRKELTREVTQHVQRLQSVLQDCNIKLDSVASSVMGKSGRAIWWPAALEYPDMDKFRTRVREHSLPYVDLVQSLLAKHGRPWMDKPAFAGGVTVADGGPGFTRAYPA